MVLYEARKYSWCGNSQERGLSFPFYSGRLWDISRTQGECLEGAALRAKWFNKWQVSKIFHGHPPFPSLAKPTVRMENCRCTVCVTRSYVQEWQSFWDNMDMWKSDHVVGICGVCFAPLSPTAFYFQNILLFIPTSWSSQRAGAVFYLPGTSPNRADRYSMFGWRNECGWFSSYPILSTIGLTEKVVRIWQRAKWEKETV